MRLFQKEYFEYNKFNFLNFVGFIKADLCDFEFKRYRFVQFQVRNKARDTIET